MSGRIWVLVGAAAALGLVAACAAMPRAGEMAIRIAGSDTMLVLNRRLAEGYMRSHPGVTILVEGGGTGAGVNALIASDVEVCAASRPLTADEVQRLYDRHRTLGVRFPVAQDGLSVWIHRSNPVTGLSTGQLRAIFSGKIGNWLEVGGDDRRIAVIVRPPASGTHRLFRDRVLLGGSYSPVAVSVASTTEVVVRVAADPGAIGYGGVASTHPGVRTCAVDGARPSADAVREGRYPLVRHLTYVTAAPPRGLARAFIDWSQGPTGQALVAEAGYLPLWRRPK